MSDKFNAFLEESKKHEGDRNLKKIQELTKELEQERHTSLKEKKEKNLLIIEFTEKQEQWEKEKSNLLAQIFSLQKKVQYLQQKQANVPRASPIEIQNFTAYKLLLSQNKALKQMLQQYCEDMRQENSNNLN